MDFRQLRYFVEVANARSFSGASTRLRVSQSSISRRIQDLENELGATLFERHANGTRLTSTGQDLLARATAILDQIEFAQNEARGQASPGGLVTLGSSLAMSRLLLAELTQRMTRDFPRVKLLFVEGTQYHLTEGLDTGRIDLAVMVSPRQIRNCSVDPLGEESLFWVHRPKSGHRGKRASLRQLDGLPLVMFPRPSAHRDMLDKAAAMDGASLNVSWEIAGVETQKDFIRRGLAHGILPFSAVSTEVSRRVLGAIPMDGIALRQCLVVRANRGNSSATVAVAETIKTIFGEMISRRVFGGSILPPSTLGWARD